MNDVRDRSFWDWLNSIGTPDNKDIRMAFNAGWELHKLNSVLDEIERLKELLAKDK